MRLGQTSNAIIWIDAQLLLSLLNSSTEVLTEKMEKLKHLVYTRTLWQQDFDMISPSMMAFFLRDSRWVDAL